MGWFPASVGPGTVTNGSGSKKDAQMNSNFPGRPIPIPVRDPSPHQHMGWAKDPEDVGVHGDPLVPELAPGACAALHGSAIEQGHGWVTVGGNFDLRQAYAELAPTLRRPKPYRSEECRSLHCLSSSTLVPPVWFMHGARVRKAQENHSFVRRPGSVARGGPTKSPSCFEALTYI